MTSADAVMAAAVAGAALAEERVVAVAVHIHHLCGLLERSVGVVRVGGGQFFDSALGQHLTKGRGRGGGTAVSR